MSKDEKYRRRAIIEQRKRNKRIAKVWKKASEDFGTIGPTQKELHTPGKKIRIGKIMR